MKWKDRRVHILAICLLSVLLFTQICMGFALLLPETPGTSVKKDGSLTVDCSHKDNGYVMVKSKKSSKKLKIRVKTPQITLNYDLNGNGDYELIPLQYGNGSYQIILYKNASGNKYAEEGKISLKVNMENELEAFLYPNQYVHYDADTAAVQEADRICKGLTGEEEIYQTVCDYIRNNFVYDFVKMVQVKSGVMPDIDGAWKKHMGICQDLAAVTVCMLRSEGIPARLMIGTAANNYHAWVTAVVAGEEQTFDPTAELNAIQKNAVYTVERYY